LTADAHYVLHVNYEDFGTDIDTLLATADGEPCWFFSGYDCDSLAMETAEQEMTVFCTRELLQHVPESLLFPCTLAA
jgi:hypothetical protein